MDVEKITRDPDMVFRRLGADMVLVPIRRGLGDFDSFYTLNELGAFIWEKLSTPQTREDLLAAIVETYVVKEETARSDLSQFLDQLEQMKAINRG